MIPEAGKKRSAACSICTAGTRALWVLAVGLGTSCKSSEDGPRAEPLRPEATVVGVDGEVYTIGATALARDYSLRVLNVRECAVEPHFRPPEGVTKLGLEVEVKGRTPKEVPVNPFYANLIASDGARYESTLAGCQPVLPAARITEGNMERGWISFDIPASATQLRFSYRPVIIGVGHEELLFEVPR